MVLVSHNGFSLRARLGEEKTFKEPDVLKGMHSGNDSFFYINKFEHKVPLPDNLAGMNILEIIDRLE